VQPAELYIVAVRALIHVVRCNDPESRLNLASAVSHWRYMCRTVHECKQQYVAVVIMVWQHVLCYISASMLCAASCRWCVAVDAEPCDMERQLLERLDYAANVVNNGQRRVSIAWTEPATTLTGAAVLTVTACLPGSARLNACQ
jgi:hypothetical protein